MKKDFPSSEIIFKACFDLIAEKGLGRSRISVLAKNLSVPLARFYKHYPNIESVILAFCDHIDHNMIKYAAEGDSANRREHYFDMMMARFDAMQPYREGIKRWLDDLSKHPDLWLQTGKRWEQSLSLMLDVARDSPLFPIKKIGLAGIYLIALKEWRQDESTDMGKTMATLDRALDRGESLIRRFMSPKKAA